MDVPMMNISIIFRLIYFAICIFCYIFFFVKSHKSGEYRENIDSHLDGYITFLEFATFILFTVTITAVPIIKGKYDEESYKAGYEAGSEEGYAEGCDDTYNSAYDDAFDDIIEVLDWEDFVDHYVDFDDGYKHATTIDYVSKYNITTTDEIAPLLQQAYQNGYGDGCDYVIDTMH